MVTMKEPIEQKKETPLRLSHFYLVFISWFAIMTFLIILFFHEKQKWSQKEKKRKSLLKKREPSPWSKSSYNSTAFIKPTFTFN